VRGKSIDIDTGKSLPILLPGISVEDMLLALKIED
jgi:hypothetical protein